MCSEIEKNTNSCKIRCRDVKDDSTNDDEDDEQFQDDSITFSQYQFYIFVLLMVGSFCGTAVTTTLADTICIAAGKSRFSFSDWVSSCWSLINQIGSSNSSMNNVLSGQGY